VAEGSLGARRLRARQVLEPLRRSAVLTERIAGAVLTGATSAFVLQHLPAYPASWTLPMFALAAAVWFVFPAAGLAWTLGTLAFCVFNVSWSLGVVYLAAAVALYWTTRGRPLTALWPVLALLLTPVFFTLVAPAAAALFGRVRGPLVAAWAGAGTLFALLLLRVGRAPFTGYQPTGDLAVRLRAAGNPLIAGARVVTILFSPQALFQMGTWAAFALAMYGIVRLARLELRLWGWSLSLATVFALYRVIPINVWHASAPLGAIVLGVSLTAVVVLLPVALGVGSVPEEQADEHP
jgi:hypothetical protein